MRYQLGILMGLWLATTAATIAAALGPELGAEIGGQVGIAVETAAKRGDVLALMALCTTASITFSAWLVKQLLSRVTDTTRVLDRLANELSRRPCIGHGTLDVEKRP